MSPLCRWLTLCLFASYFPLETTCSAQEPQPPEKSWAIFSNEGRALAPLRADPREAQLRAGFLFRDNGHIYQDVALGADLGILHRRSHEGGRLSITGRGVISARFDFMSESFDLQNVDFIGGIAVGYHLKNLALEALISHQSSHLGDEVLDNGDRKRIDFGLERVRLLGSYNSGNLRLYGGPSIIYNSNPSSLEWRVLVQVGAEYFGHFLKIPVYAASDIQIQTRDIESSGLTFQTGVELGNPEIVKRRQRIFIELFHGNSNMGQFFLERERYIMFGLGYNFR
ncbi:DUF1207 domain-containing protein [Thermodesulfobacteriota bacterium]